VCFLVLRSSTCPSYLFFDMYIKRFNLCQLSNIMKIEQGFIVFSLRMYVIKTLTGEEVKLPGYKIPYDAFESFFMRSLSKKC
jgi:hypothetical protein